MHHNPPNAGPRFLMMAYPATGNLINIDEEEPQAGICGHLAAVKDSSTPAVSDSAVVKEEPLYLKVRGGYLSHRSCEIKACITHGYSPDPNQSDTESVLSDQPGLIAHHEEEYFFPDADSYLGLHTLTHTEIGCSGSGTWGPRKNAHPRHSRMQTTYRSHGRPAGKSSRPQLAPGKDKSANLGGMEETISRYEASCKHQRIINLSSLDAWRRQVVWLGKHMYQSRNANCQE